MHMEIAKIKTPLTGGDKQSIRLWTYRTEEFTAFLIALNVPEKELKQQGIHQHQQ